MMRATGRWTGCLEIRDTLERKVFDSLADLLNLEVDLLFFDTTSTYFETEEGRRARRPGQERQPRSPARMERGRDGKEAGVPHLGEVQGSPR